MISLLAKLFIKDYTNVTDSKVREAYGVLCGGMGIALNILLFLGKFLAGTLSGSIAITADAFNNLSDAGSSFITLIGFKLGSQKPDPEHPFGHGRIEYLSGLAVAVLIIVMAVELFKSSFDKILHPEVLECSAVIVLILIASIAVKIYMAIYNHSVGRKIQSAAMGATAKDSMSDTVATTVVLLATLVGAIWGVPIDGYCGVLVSILIFMAGFGAIKDTVGPLLGTAPEKEFVDKIEEIVMSHDIVKGMHDLVVHDYGPGRVMISLHAEVPHTEDILVIHDEIDNIEEELGDKLNCEAVIHMDPIIVDDEKVNEVKEYVCKIVHQVGEELNFHDFRMVSGNSHTNLIFDVVVPFKYKMSDEVIKKAIQEAIWVNYPRYNAVIHIDHAYC